MKLIKPQDNYYILSNDEIKEGDWCLRNGVIEQCNSKMHSFALWGKDAKKITHSTQALEVIGVTDDGNNYIQDFDKIKPLNLSEIEEAINGYNLREMAIKAYPFEYDDEFDYKHVSGYKQGFKAAMKLSKDKLFTIEDMRVAYQKGALYGGGGSTYYFDNLIQSLLPKTEWDVEFIDGKIKLI